MTTTRRRCRMTMITKSRRRSRRRRRWRRRWGRGRMDNVNMRKVDMTCDWWIVNGGLSCIRRKERWI